MKNKKWSIGLFVLAALMQIAVLLAMAWRWEDVLQTGRPFYWQTAPVDPYDAFKGRYVQLDFTGNTVQTDDIATFSGKWVYAVIAENADGRAYISDICSERPAAGYYVKARAYSSGHHTLQVRLPFTRYYLPEEAAPAAQAAYRESAGKQTGTAVVRIKGGYSVVEQLYIGEQTLLEFLQSPQKNEER